MAFPTSNFWRYCLSVEVISSMMVGSTDFLCMQWCDVLSWMTVQTPWSNVYSSMTFWVMTPYHVCDDEMYGLSVYHFDCSIYNTGCIKFFLYMDREMLRLSFLVNDTRSSCGGWWILPVPSSYLMISHPSFITTTHHMRTWCSYQGSLVLPPQGPNCGKMQSCHYTNLITGRTVGMSICPTTTCT